VKAPMRYGNVSLNNSTRSIFARASYCSGTEGISFSFSSSLYQGFADCASPLGNIECHLELYISASPDAWRRCLVYNKPRTKMISRGRPRNGVEHAAGACHDGMFGAVTGRSQCRVTRQAWTILPPSLIMQPTCACGKSVQTGIQKSKKEGFVHIFLCKNWRLSGLDSWYEH
jgi:hypothetical protein